MTGHRGGAYWEKGLGTLWSGDDRVGIVYGQPIHIKRLAYGRNVRPLGKATVDEITEIILDTNGSGHDCALEQL